MSNTWPKTKLGDLLQPVDRAEAVDASREYRILGVRWYGEGFFEKDRKLGQEIKAQKIYRVHEGDFAYNRLFAWKGSFAVADSKADGCYVSNEFPCFEPVPTRVDAKFLKWWFRRENAWTEALGLSSGATPTSRNRLKEQHFLAMDIPLPPLEEQQRIVAQIEELASQIHEVLALRQQVAVEVEALCRSLITRDKGAVLVPMRELVKPRRPDVAVRTDEIYQFAGVYCFGRGVFRSSQKTGMEFAYPRLTRLRAGNFVYPKLMAWEGAFGVVPPECDDCVVSTEFPVFEIAEERVLPEVLDTYFRMPSIWPAISGASTGTNVRRRRLNPQEFLNYKMPLPSRVTQEILRRVRAETASLNRLQAETAAELDALLPAILDRAFRGEL